MTMRHCRTNNAMERAPSNPQGSTAPIAALFFMNIHCCCFDLRAHRTIRFLEVPAALQCAKIRHACRRRLDGAYTNVDLIYRSASAKGTFALVSNSQANAIFSWKYGFDFREGRNSAKSLHVN